MNLENSNARFWMSFGCLLAALTVGLGAFGAHGLEDRITASVEDPEKNMGYWETATRYQMYHCIGIIVVVLGCALSGARRIFDVTGTLFVFGILIFSGFLYAIALTDIKFLGAIVPIGGLAMIVGWVTLAIGFFGSPKLPTGRNDE